jgi:hypothetical protein
MQPRRQAHRRLWPWLGLLALSLGVLAGIGWEVWPYSAIRPFTLSRPAIAPSAAASVADERRAVRLFLIHEPKGVLVELSAQIPRRVGLAEEMRSVLRLLADPVDGELRPPLPAGLEIHQLFLDAFGVLYLDCSPAILQLATGPTGSDLAISALALTLSSTFTEVKRVQILSGGQEVALLAGAVDLRRPVSPRFPGDEAPPPLPAPVALPQ